MDIVDDLRAAWVGYFEVEMKAPSYKNKKVAVLGAGLSGAAAALLLQSEGANVTVLRQVPLYSFGPMHDSPSFAVLQMLNTPSCSILQA